MRNVFKNEPVFFSLDSLIIRVMSTEQKQWLLARPENQVSSLLRRSESVRIEGNWRRFRGWKRKRYREFHFWKMVEVVSGQRYLTKNREDLKSKSLDMKDREKARKKKSTYGNKNKLKSNYVSRLKLFVFCQFNSKVLLAN